MSFKLLGPLIVVAVAAAAIALSVAGNRTGHKPEHGELQVAYDTHGIQKISWAGIDLEDSTKYPTDAFHIWHMKATDLSGKIASGGQYGWGENNSSRTWDAETHTWAYTFVWGSIDTQFVQIGNSLDINVTVTNRAGSGVVIDGATIYPLVLHFPKAPTNLSKDSQPQFATNITEPSVTMADFGLGEVALVVTEPGKPLYSGFWPASENASYVPVVSSTSPDGLAKFPHTDRPVRPGEIDRFTVSLRFAASGNTAALAQDVYSNWIKRWPSKLRWADRRPIGTVYLASSPSGDLNSSGGYRNNPRRYFNDGNAADFDVTTAAGLANFQARVLRQAAMNVVNARKLGAQGAITWDIEGEEYPQSTSYVCAPDMISRVAPEMESIVTTSDSRYRGMRLDDAYFKTMTDAGFRVGVCIRPQHFLISDNHKAAQITLNQSEVLSEILRKMKFAHDRWGATLFYIDSTVDPDGGVLDADLFDLAAHELPDSLLIPEEHTAKHYAYTAPFQSFLFHGDVGTDSSVQAYYPDAFSVNLVNDVNSQNLKEAMPSLTAAVKRGDILMGHVDYWDENNSTIASIYRSAGTWRSITRDSQRSPASSTK